MKECPICKRVYDDNASKCEVCNVAFPQSENMRKIKNIKALYFFLVGIGLIVGLVMFGRWFYYNWKFNKKLPQAKTRQEAIDNLYQHVENCKNPGQYVYDVDYSFDNQGGIRNRDNAPEIYELGETFDRSKNTFDVRLEFNDKGKYTYTITLNYMLPRSKSIVSYEKKVTLSPYTADKVLQSYSTDSLELAIYEYDLHPEVSKTHELKPYEQEMIQKLNRQMLASFQRYIEETDKIGVKYSDFFGE